MSDYHILLFDIDGVLVEPYGYRESVRATLNYFYQQMKFPKSLLPDDNVLSGFEAIRITSEWDMVPICLAASIDSWLAGNPDFCLPDQLSAAIRMIGQAAPDANLPCDPGYLHLQQSLKGALKPGEYPADTILRLARSNRSDLFTHLAGSSLLDNLLAHSRDLYLSTTTRIFQHYTLGSQAFQECYQLPASFETGSLLARFDRPLLPDNLSKRILEMSAQGAVYPAAFTMRPSLAPRGAVGRLEPKYVPEAEIALELVHLPGMPLIGYGRILYLADRIGLEAESLLKPSPVQAIAAILAALSGDERLALTEAYNAYAKNVDFSSTQLQPGDTLIIHVFEDSAGGIEAVFKAADIFKANGISSRVSAYGIATHPEKTAALKQIGASIYASTTQALRHALESLTGG